MITTLHGMRTRLVGTLRVRAHGPMYAPFVGLLAFLVTLSMSIPFGSLLAVSVLLAPRRWRLIVLCSSLGSAAGGMVLYLVFHHLGWTQLVAQYPEIARTAIWGNTSRWLAAYGVVALFAVAATPIPQTPAVLFAAISRFPAGEVLLALFLGKLLKYGLYGWLASAFPSMVKRWAPMRSG